MENFLNNSQQLENKNSKYKFVAVLGAKGSGKTLFTTAILSSIVDGEVKDMTGTVSEATHEFLNRHLMPMKRRRQWPEPTRGWNDLSLSLRWELNAEKIHDYKLSFQDIQGSDFETLTEDLILKMDEAVAYFFIISPKHLLTEEELLQAAGENAYLESIIPEEGRFARQVNWNYSQALEKLSESLNFQKEVEGQKTSRPISVIFTRKDDYPHLEIDTLKKKFLGTFKWFQAHARYIEYFFVSSVGNTTTPDPEQDKKNKEVFIAQYGEKLDLDLPAKKSPPETIDPQGVIEPLKFVLNSITQEKIRRKQKLFKQISTAAIIFSILFVFLWFGNWAYTRYISVQMRQENARILKAYIDKNPEQPQDIYVKIAQYLADYGASHREGRMFLAVQKRITPQVQEKWFNKVSMQAKECDRDNKTIAEYAEACRVIEEYLRSSFSEGKGYLRELKKRLENRKNLAKVLEEVNASEEHGDFRHAIRLLDGYLKKESFQKSFIAEKKSKLRELLSASLYQKAIQQITVLSTPEKLEAAIYQLTSFINQEKPFLSSQDRLKLESEVLELKGKLAQLESEKAFTLGDYKQSRSLLQSFIRTDGISDNLKITFQNKLKKLSQQEYQKEFNAHLKYKGKRRLDSLNKFQNRYENHPSFHKQELLLKVCFSLYEIAKDAEQKGNWQEGISTFTTEEQRFPDLVTLPEYWKYLLPLVYGRVYKLADQGDYETGWSLLKTFQIKLSGQLKLKNFLEQLLTWSKKLAELELESKWKTIVLQKKTHTIISALEKFRTYQTQPFFSEIYRAKYHKKVEEKRFSANVSQYEAALTSKDFAQARLVLEQYEGWGVADSYRAKIENSKKTINKQEIMSFWKSCIKEVNNSFRTTAEKLELAKEFQRLHKEKAGYKYVEEELEVLAQGLSNNLKAERKHKVDRQIARAFEDETALAKARELFQSFQKQYPGEENLSRFQAQLHQARVSWVSRHLEACGDLYDPTKRYEAYERFLRKYSGARYLYRDLLQKAEKLKKNSALEWDKREFQKAESAWRDFQYRADEFPPKEGRKRMQELIKLFEGYSKHWGPEKKFTKDAQERILFVRQLLNGAKYTVRLLHGEFAKNYWMFKPSVEVSVTVGEVTYPYKIFRDRKKIHWKEDKEFFWKAYEPIKILVKDKDKSKKNNLLLHQETGFFSLFKLCTSEDDQKKLQAFRVISNDHNSITFSLMGSSVPQINQWYGIKSTVDRRQELPE